MSRSTARAARNTRTYPLKSQLKPRKRKPAVKSSNRRYGLLLLEITGILVTTGLWTLIILGYTAQHFSGTRLFSHLLPFAGGVIGLVVCMALALVGWHQLRSRLRRQNLILPALAALALTIGSAWLVMNQNYWMILQHFKTLVGGKQLVQHDNVAHQVYAAYRRQDQKLLLQLLERSRQYQSSINEAAKHYALDTQILYGLAATESSFLPRDSVDGGHGLFQITAIPKTIQQQTQQTLAVARLDLNNPRHNAYLAAATLKFYLTQMHDDLYLGLLAYNIGPRNGGLRFIMDQYGADDFVSMQPYLQALPRDYPIRVLSHALAFRLWQQDGKLLAYQEGHNAQHIQGLGIPGLDDGH